MTQVDMHALIWALRQLDSALQKKPFGSKDTSTLAEFVAENGLSPVWHNEPETDAAILAGIIELVKPSLDASVLDLETLDLSGFQYAGKAKRHISSLVGVLDQRQRNIVTNFQLAEMGPEQAMTPERADQVAKKAVEEGVVPHEMTGALEQAFLILLRYGRVAEAMALKREFSPEANRQPAVFKNGVIPSGPLGEAVIAGVKIIFDNIAEEDGEYWLGNADLYVTLGVLNQHDVDKNIKARILDCARYGSTIPAGLMRYGGLLVSADELVDINKEKIASVSGDLRKPEYSLGNTPAGAVAELKKLGVAEPEIDPLVKEGYLFLLARNGKGGREVEQYRVLLKENAVTADEERQALTTFADSLVKSVNIGKDWLATAAAYKQYFRPGMYQKAVFAAAYQATYGYHSHPEVAAELKAANPDFPWEVLSSLHAPCQYAGVDLRNIVSVIITDDTERKLARVFFDWVGSRLDSPDSAGTYLTWLRESCALAAGLGKKAPNKLYSLICGQVDHDEIAEGRTTEDAIAKRKSDDELKAEARAHRILAEFGGQLDGVPYQALVNLRQKVAIAVRAAKPGSESIDFI